MIKPLMIILSIIVLVCLGWIVIRFINPENYIYAIYIGTNSDDFEDDATASASGEVIDGDVFVYLNGNCISFYGGYGKMIQINQWLKSGKNILSVRGDSSKNIFLKAVKYRADAKSFKVIAKSKIHSGKIDLSIGFNANIDFVLPLYKNRADENNIDIENELRMQVEKLNLYLENGDRNALYDKFLHGPSIWQPIAYSVEWKTLKPMLKNKIVLQFIAEKIKIVDFEKSKLKFIFGKNSVYVYSGINRNTSIPVAYLFQMRRKKELIDIPALKFVYIDGEWIVWE